MPKTRIRVGDHEVTGQKMDLGRLLTDREWRRSNNMLDSLFYKQLLKSGKTERQSLGRGHFVVMKECSYWQKHSAEAGRSIGEVSYPLSLCLTSSLLVPLYGQIQPEDSQWKSLEGTSHRSQPPRAEGESGCVCQAGQSYFSCTTGTELRNLIHDSKVKNFCDGLVSKLGHAQHPLSLCWFLPPYIG